MKDRIMTIDDAPIESWEVMVTTIQAAEGRELTIVVDREGSPVTMQVTPRIKTFKTLSGEEVTVPVIGIERGYETAFKPVEGLGLTTAIKQTWNNSKLVVMGFVNIVKRLIPMESIGGPIMIAQVIHQGAQSGVFDVLQLAAIISINLAIINLLPIPVLDGGHIVYCLLEIIFRRPVSDRWKAVATRIGILFLLVLMSLAIFNDVRRLLLYLTDLVLAMGGTEERLQAVLGQPGPNGCTLLASREWTVPGQSIKFLTPGLKEMLDAFGIGVDAIGKIACVRGPGSFTGLRLVLAAAEGLAAGHGIPLAGLDYLPLLASGPAQLLKGHLHVLTYARRGLVYLETFDAPSLDIIQPLTSLTLEEAAERMAACGDTAHLMGSGLRKIPTSLPSCQPPTPATPCLARSGTTHRRKCCLMQLSMPSIRKRP